MKGLMKTLPVLAFCCLFLLGEAFAAGAEVELLLYERNPWLTVIGSDSPLVACYTDGVMIFLDRPASGKSGRVYKSVRLGEAAQAELRSRMKALDGLQGYYELSQATDQTTTQIVFLSEGKLKHVSSYGGVPRELEQFIGFLGNLQTQAGASAVSWRPACIEVMLWPFGYAGGAALWPKEFPGLDSPATVKRGESSYSIYLPIAEEKKFRDFMKANQDDAVLIDGKKWAVAVRIPFPHEMPPGLTATETPAVPDNVPPGKSGDAKGILAQPE